MTPSPSDRITLAENVALLRCSHGRVAALAFGPAGVWLERDRRDGHVVSAWAPPLLNLWRGEAVIDGGGI
ncbi:hypothetical protein [Phenylobacterium sp. SCN 70-31]|uniref:hypothetical protein n=1 Tax=Phenylobacterium sp. SCN 70-31 TaxID=1660129 RepID=UPI00086B6969|nr:hypothetical protein [Phenylobacterium sp. SCN 70-31]ODT83573.1 MAG: hypothetical protein ABS78_23110 [Phenylobacterium sp. SCN 70-31]